MWKKFGMFVGAMALAVVVAPRSSEAVSVVDAYLFSDWSAPTNASSPPFTFTPTTGVELSLDGSQVATGYSEFVPGGSVSFTDAFTYSSHTGTINPELAQDAGTQGPQVNSEVGMLDDVGVFSPGADVDLNTDFGAQSAVIFALPDDGVRAIMLGEDAGLDPFKLELCGNATCTSGVQTLFNGFDGNTQTNLLARSDFGADDLGSGPIDQVYLFELDQEAFGYVRVTEIGDFGGTESLEVDFIGGVEPVIPEPASMLLFGFGALGAVGLRRRRKQIV